MFSIFKRKSNKTEVPEWASFFTPEEYGEFIKSIQNYFYEKNITYELGDGLLQVGPNDFGFGILGLMNAAQACKQDAIKHYPEIVSSYFDAMVKTNEFNKEFEKIVLDYDQIEQYICVRLYSHDYFSHLGPEFTITQHIAGDVYAVLVFDLPDTVVTIKQETVTPWNKTTAELFEKAIQNSKKKHRFNISKENLGDFGVDFVGGEHFFVPNVLFELQEHPQLIGSKGSLIGIPHRHAIIVYPIESIAVANVITSLIPIIYGMNQEGPGSISNQLLWYRDGQFENLPYKIEDGKIQFYPTENFVEMLNSITG